MHFETGAVIIISLLQWILHPKKLRNSFKYICILVFYGFLKKVRGSRGLCKFLWLFWTHAREGSMNSMSSASHSGSKHHFLRIGSCFIHRMKLLVHKRTIVTEPYFSQNFRFGPDLGKSAPQQVKNGQNMDFFDFI